jgi:hypothetical protein
MYFARFALVKLAVLSDRMFLYMENKRFEKTLQYLIPLIKNTII